MASSSVSDDSKAPENFQVSSSNDEDNCSDDDDRRRVRGNARERRGKKQVTIQVDPHHRQQQQPHHHHYHHHHQHHSEDDATTLKCPLCGTRQRHFCCRNCVRKGNVVHSESKQHSESLSDKQQKYLNIQRGAKVFSDNYERLVAARKSSETLQFQITQRREQIALLDQLVAAKTSKLQSLKEKRDKLWLANAEKRKTLPNYPIKVKSLSDYVLDRIEKINKLRERHHKQLGDLQRTTRRNIQQLVEYIFPIDEIVLKEEFRQQPPVPLGSGNASGHAKEESDTIAALAEAKNTSYIRGKWVFHGSSISEMQYRIVAPSLPANGDYTAYLDWLAENKDDVPKTTSTEITPSRINGFRIAGALTYTTQLTHLLSYYLNVRLPYKLAYGDFCRKLNEEQFLRKVSRLNSNIMYLAYTQQVQLRTLNENHTLENILTLLDLDKSDLGRHGFQEVANAPLMKSVDSLLLGIETATESESEDENSLRLDWEAVPSVPSVSHQELLATNLLPPSSTQQSTMTEGLMTSAANRLTSILRWMK